LAYVSEPGGQFGIERLTECDFRATLDFLHELYTPACLDEFPSVLVGQIRKLIPCDLATYGEMNLDRHISIDRASPAEGFPPEVSGLWQHVMHEHPVLTHRRRTGDLQAYRIADFYSESQFHRLALYQEYYRKIHMGATLGVGLGVSGPRLISCALHRPRRNFTLKDCLICDLIGPHVIQAWQNARALSRVRRQMQAMGGAQEALECAAVTLGPSGRLKVMTPEASAILGEFFKDGSAGDWPEMLDRWVHKWKGQFSPNQLPQPLAPLVIERGRARLVVRLVTSSSQDLLLLQTQRSLAEAMCAGAPGLTQREGEVLAWVTEGKTNGAIGLILGVSPRTVPKHLEHIFAKLGVETRTAAARVALRVLPRRRTL
jgi:DNA-binding CsgD family transcriptional regulator